MSDYIYDQAWAAEKQRLDALAALYDSGTTAHLSRFVTPGSAWLEVGAGSGTVAAWLADAVGDEGKVVATDLDTRFLDSLRDRVEVRTHDVVQRDLEPESFDGAHARAVLEHLPERRKAIANIASALRPGGWFVAEDVVFPPPHSHPPDPALAKVLDAFATAFRAAGADPHYGLALPSALEDAGFTSVGFDGRVPVVRSGTPSADFAALSLDQLGDLLVAAGLLTHDEVAAASKSIREPGTTTLATVMVTAWGRKPS